MHALVNGRKTAADILSLMHKDQRVFNKSSRKRLQELKNRFSKPRQQKCMELSQENLCGI